MHYNKIFIWLAILVIISQLIPLISWADEEEKTIVISEVIANPETETTDEFIELYNSSTEAIDVAGWQFTDGDSLDQIVSWQTEIHGEISGAITGTTEIPSETYVIILDPDYLSGGLPYSFPANIIILTVENSSLGNGLTGSSDPITLYNSEGTEQINVIDTYGTPISNDDPLECDDDGLDNIPFDPGNGISVEKIDLNLEDTETNWSYNADGQATPGSQNNPFVNLPPEILSTIAEPAELVLNGSDTTLLKVHVTDANGPENIASVLVNLSSVGSEANSTMYDNGTNGDEISGDDWHTLEFLPSQILNPGDYSLPITATDLFGEAATAEISLELQEPSYSENLVINELLPNPSGPETDSEFIEIYNSGDDDIDLANWKLSDGSRTWTIPSGNTLNTKNYIAFYNQITNISLNNTGDAVSLLAPNDEERDQVAYTESANEEESYARKDSGQFSWTTTSTPNAQNIFTGEDVEAKIPSDDNSSGTSSTNNPAETNTETKLQTISEIRKASKDSEVKTRGIVIALPNTLNSKYFYIQDENSGIQIYSSDANFPELKLGDEIEVTGKLSNSQGESRINIREGKLEIISSKNIPEPKSLKTGEIKEESEGMLIFTKGILTKQSGLTFYLDDKSGETKISILKNTNIDKPKMTKGDSVGIVGVVSETKSGYRILPRMQDDFREGGDVATESDAAQIAGASTGEMPNAGAGLDLILAISVTGTGGALAIRRIWK